MFNSKLGLDKKLNRNVFFSFNIVSFFNFISIFFYQLFEFFLPVKLNRLYLDKFNIFNFKIELNKESGQKISK
jgi:hypothetical protein